MHGAVFLMQGSDNTCSSGTCGSCAITVSLYRLEVTTHTFSMGITSEKRSTVNCSRLFPTPKTSMNCLGISGVLIGQRRLPTPPAMTIK